MRRKIFNIYKFCSLRAATVLSGRVAAVFFAATCVPAASVPAHAEDTLYRPRIEANIRAGSERSIVMTEAWVPLAQEKDRVIYGDIRLMGDDDNNREWNFGVGYRALNPAGDAVLGVHGWFDRRRSSRGSVFYQAAGGFEYLSNGLDIRLNGYAPFNTQERYAIGGASTTPYLADTGIYYDSNGLLVEKPLHGADIEFAVPVNFFAKAFDSFRVSAGGFIFDAAEVESLRGIRLRAAADVTSDFQIGARFETDNQRGAQAFAEATVRFPFGAKSSARAMGLRSRMDESPERDIDVVTAARVAVAPSVRNAVINNLDGQAQRIFYVDNTAAGGGDGSLENPFNTLSAAQSAMTRAGDVLYINRGDGTAAGQNTGLSITHQGQSVIGSGADFIYDGTRFTAAAAGQDFSGILLRAADTSLSAPVITNINANGDGVFVGADNVMLSGFDISGADGNGISVVNAQGTYVQGVNIDGSGGHGIFAQTNTAGARNINISSLSVQGNNGDGIRIESNGAGVWRNVVLAGLDTFYNEHGVYIAAQTGGQIQNLSMTDVDSTHNGRRGVYMIALNGGRIDTASLLQVDALDNSEAGIQVVSNNAVIGSFSLRESSSMYNRDHGVYVYALTSGQIGAVTLADVDTVENDSNGIFILSGSASQNGTTSLTRVTAVDNGTNGIHLRASSGGLSASVSNATVTGNGTNGVFVDNDSTGAFTVDMGGGTLASTGGNRIFGNLGTDLRVDLNGAELKAENNWWGDQAGLLPTRRVLEVSSTVDADPWLEIDPGP